MKPFTIAAALESGKVTPSTVIDTGGGAMTIGSMTIHDAHRAGALTVEQVIQKSSNIGAAKIALSLPPVTMWQMLSDTGFGAAPNTGYPGEVAGRLRPAKTWKPIEQATMAYGHGISVNLVQLARAYTVFATEGQLKPATLFKAGTFVTGRPVMKPETALAVRHMLELAVLPGGTAPKAQIPGYRVAGKTGTAHKLEGRGYTNKYVSSFVGFAPASAPRLIVAVMIDEPTAGVHYGGDVAAPVFSTVMGSVLRTLGVPPDAPSDNVILPDAAAAIREET
jgi:cell division protein FtsI (penicillin-binding protein 3)